MNRRALSVAAGIGAIGFIVTCFAFANQLNVNPRQIIPNDGRDDSVAIQAMIDRLPRSDGSYRTSAPQGGTIRLPAGIININRPVLVPSGVRIIGEGSQATVIHPKVGEGRYAFELASTNNGHNANFHAEISDLKIYGFDNSGGISFYRGQERLPRGYFAPTWIENLTLSELAISTLGTGIDLPSPNPEIPQHIYGADLRNITIFETAGTAIRFHGRHSVITGLRWLNYAREGHRENAETKPWLADFEVSACTFIGFRHEGFPEQPGLRLRGTATFLGMWHEKYFTPGKQTVPSMEFIDAYVEMDHLFFAGNQRPIYLTNSTLRLGRLALNDPHQLGDVEQCVIRRDADGSAVIYDTIGYVRAKSTDGKNVTAPFEK